MNDKIPFLQPEDLSPQFIFSALSETTDWGHRMLGLSEAHKHTRGAGIVVAVLDTGSSNHFDLVENMLPGIDATACGDHSDKQGHGTHCSGIIAAQENGIGIVGVAPLCKILPIKVLNDSGQSGFDEIARGINLAVQHGADVISMSLGTAAEPPEWVHSAIKNAAAQGVIIFAASGNDAGQVNWPARYPEIIAVAAVDQKGKLASFSSHGPQVAVCGPGVKVYSTYLDNQYSLLSGTSQATPYIAGVGALLLSWSRNTPGAPKITNYRDMLELLGRLSEHGGRDKETGYGIVHFTGFEWSCLSSDVTQGN